MTALAFALCRRLGLARPLAAGGACVFAVHPSRCENVSWASGVTDLLCAAPLLGSLLIMLSLTALARGTRSRRTGFVLWAGALALYAVALGAKEIAVLFPGLVLAAGLARDEASGRVVLSMASLRRGIAYSLPFAGLAGVYLLARQSIIGGVSFPVPGAPDFVTTLQTLPLIIVFYLKQMVLPWEIGPMYPVRPVENLGLMSFVLPLVVVVLVGAGLVWAMVRTRSRGTIVGAALLVLPLLPAMNIGSFLPEQLVHDRYLYLPLLGLMIVVLSIVPHAARSKERAINVVAFVVAAACIPLAVQTTRYNRAWMSDVALWAWAVKSDPTSAFAHTQHGINLLTAGRLIEARATFERSMAIQPTTRVRLGLADLDFRENKLADAEQRLVPLVDQPPADMAPLELFAAGDCSGGSGSNATTTFLALWTCTANSARACRR